MTIKGIDVSGYQSATYSTADLDFVIVKVTEGLSYINPRWVAQRDRAKRAGLVWGAYHYPHMANDPIQEADYFLKQVAWAPGDIIVFDWEGYDSANTGVSKSRQLTYRDAWLTHVKAKMPGHRVGMYCNLDYWTNIDTTSNCGDFLWIATAGLPAGSPGVTHQWTFHQYSTAGDIDHDVANFASRAALAAWAAGAAPTEEDDVPLTKDDLKTLATTDGVFTSPDGAKDATGNEFWTMASYLRYGYLQGRDANASVRTLAAKLDTQSQTIDKLVGAVATLSASVGDLDPQTVVAELKAAIKSIDIRLDIPETPDPATS